ncbi:hypothetical protein HZH68_000146 [Vespula germanica]|uniref:Uncharacterized protein n=1 Tax=Vespula germanica TaxID=30212 RepID=A0A834NT93_VESGE|nr:hypothetical protein HZH68_000146 [Vespula germanica]
MIAIVIFDGLAWLLGWLVGWLVGWLAGWLVGWLVGWLADLESLMADHKRIVQRIENDWGNIGWSRTAA